ERGARARRDRRPAAGVAAGSARRAHGGRGPLVLDGVSRLGRGRRVRRRRHAETSIVGAAGVTAPYLCALPRRRYIPAPASRSTRTTIQSPSSAPDDEEGWWGRGGRGDLSGDLRTGGR